MDTTNYKKAWTLPQKVLFRFFFVYFILYLEPWSWFSFIPGLGFLMDLYGKGIEWLVIKANAHIFQVFGIRDVHFVQNGSGDTSFYWAQNCFFLSVAFISCLAWTVFDRHRRSYYGLNYLLCLLVRYSLALISLGYGIQKVFALQMPFPMLSQLATPLGDFLPMRFSWLFIGYSTPYEVFSGAMEVLVAVSLLWRRTATLGVLVATAVFTNVMMLNLCYDIPVKLYAMNLVLMCLFLVANEYHRIACFFVMNKPADICNIYHFPLTRKWMRITRIVIKVAIFFLAGKTLYEIWTMSKQFEKMDVVQSPVKAGMYDVVKFVCNKDTIPPLITDTLRWQDVIFEKNGLGSIKTVDTFFRKRYGRGYFSFTPDSMKHTMVMRGVRDSLLMNYFFTDSNTIVLTGKKKNDMLFVELKESNRHFQLAEKQFHWLSEANR